MLTMTIIVENANTLQCKVLYWYITNDHTNLCDQLGCVDVDRVHRTSSLLHNIDVDHCQAQTSLQMLLTAYIDVTAAGLKAL